MRVIITKRFEKEYLKSLLKYFSKNDLAENMKNKNHNFISLHHPYFKFKNKINSLDFRGILVFINNTNIVPLIIFFKKDKKYGENINWQIYKDNILYEYDIAIKNIENMEFEIY